jgi:hypothetical protein
MLSLAGRKVYKARYSILEVELPGRPKVAAGVVLLDPESDELHLKLRPDWEALADPEDVEVLSALEGDLKAKALASGGDKLLHELEDKLSNVVRISDRIAVTVGDFQKALARLYERFVEGLRAEVAEVARFHTHLPVFSLAAAAGKWGEDTEVEPEGWARVPENLRPTEEMFVAQVVGRSMEPLIPEESYCIFRGGLVAGSRQGKLLLIWNRTTSESGGRYTIKRYTSEKTADEEGWRHERIHLEPLNPDFDAWDLDPSEFESGAYRVIGEFVRVLAFEEM